VMRRLTARFLLLFVAAGATAPLLQALSADPPHACCLRRLHGRSERDPRLHDAATTQGNCCPPVTTPHSAQVKFVSSSISVPSTIELTPERLRVRYYAGFDSNHSSRAPPALVLIYS